MAEKLRKSPSTIERRMARLKDNKVIRRIGARKTGYWEIACSSSVPLENRNRDGYATDLNPTNSRNRDGYATNNYDTDNYATGEG